MPEGIQPWRSICISLQLWCSVQPHVRPTRLKRRPDPPDSYRVSKNRASTQSWPYKSGRSHRMSYHSLPPQGQMEDDRQPALGSKRPRHVFGRPSTPAPLALSKSHNNLNLALLSASTVNHSQSVLR